MLINKVCVIGSGVMGSGIAAHIANSGTQVLLLDIALEGLSANTLTEQALVKLQNSSPAALSHPEKLKYIEIGNIKDDLHKIDSCQWIIEVIVEKEEVKRDLYSKIEQYISQDTIISSNTSTIPLRQLKLGRSVRFKENFLITHFFNPPRYMRLLEIVTDKETSKYAKEAVTNFITHKLGKGVIECNDTPGFIANRIGCFFLEMAMRKALKYQVDITEVDFICNKILGMPRTGIFGLIDLIGIDLMKLISESMINLLPKNDAYHNIYYKVEQIEKMIAEGYTGRKGKGGFSRVIKTENGKVSEQLSLSNFEYKKASNPKPTISSFKELMESDSNIGKYFQEILCEIALYCASVIPSVTENPYDIDKAMTLGYNWKKGPFKIGKEIGADTLKVLAQKYNIELNNTNLEIFHSLKEDGFYTGISSLAHYHNKKLLTENSSSKLWDLKDALCFEITSKMASLNNEVHLSLYEAVSHAEKFNKALIIYNDNNYFSAGADLANFLSYIDNKEFSKVEEAIKIGQKTMQRLQDSKVNIISCAKGFALGGGCEVLLHSSHIVANIETNAGLVEIGVGLIPGWGGLKEIIIRSKGSKNKLLENLSHILLQHKTPSAEYINQYFDCSNVVVNMNIELLLEEAIELAKLKYHSPTQEKKVTIPIIDLASEIDLENTDEHTKKIANLITKHISGKTLSSIELFAIESEIFMELIQDPQTRAKIASVLGSA